MHSGRALTIALLALIAALGAAWLRQHGTAALGWYPGCPLRQTTGLLCPGCGFTRATVAALRGEFSLAFRYHSVGLLILPPLLLVAALAAFAWIRGWHITCLPRPGKRTVIALGIGAITFTVLRNLPWWPFTLLAPP